MMGYTWHTSSLDRFGPRPLVVDVEGSGVIGVGAVASSGHR